MNRRSLSLALLLLVALSACSRQPVYPSPALSGHDAVIDASLLKPETPQFYTYKYGGKSISFFVLKLNDRVLSFFDACASCYPSKLGYRYVDGKLVCRACDMNFSMHKLEQGLGGCYPIKIEGKMANGKYMIPLAALEAEAGKF